MTARSGWSNRADVRSLFRQCHLVLQLKYPAGFFLADRADLCTSLEDILSRISYAAMACIRNDTVSLVSIWQGDFDNSHT